MTSKERSSMYTTPTTTTTTTPTDCRKRWMTSPFQKEKKKQLPPGDRMRYGNRPLLQFSVTLCCGETELSYTSGMRFLWHSNTIGVKRVALKSAEKLEEVIWLYWQIEEAATWPQMLRIENGRRCEMSWESRGVSFRKFISSCFGF